jgi:carnitine O-acetyltransferase
MVSTFQYQKDLQKLPIPDLNETCSTYLKLLKPLQSEKEHNRTVEAVENFLKTSGPYLDQELRNYTKSRNSYIEQFWYDSYLSYDSPVVLNLNPFFLLEDDPFNSDSASNPQIKRATALTISSLKFIQALKNETLQPDIQRNGKPLCMYQYSKLFGAARIPTSNGCIMQSDPTSNHLVVMSKSQFYWFDVLDSKNHIILSEAELMVNFTSIIRDSLKTSRNDIAKSSFGVLTTENRRIWANTRSQIYNNQTNNAILDIIDKALFILCLDDIEITDLSELSKNMLCGISTLEKGIQVGTCTNRWYDKLQIIITKNGKAGVNFEHTGVDGHTVLRFVSDIYTDSILSFAQSINHNAPSLWKNATTNDDFSQENLITIPRKLEWDLTPELSLSLRFGETRLSDLINQNEFKHLEYKSYGASQIKKMKFSPDAFVQMAFQATYYALYGKVECTYEPVMTKQFFHGRTEAIRTVSEESNLFVRKFFDSKVSNADKFKLLNDACAAHSAQTRKSSQGHGVDRHLYALFSIWRRYVDDSIENEHHDENSSDTTIIDSNHKGDDIKELPAIFADAGWDRLNTTIISTSNCGNPSLRLFGFGPVSANGFGIGYIIKDDSISICASSKHRQTERFLVTLESYLTEILSMWKHEQEIARLSEKLTATIAHPTPKANNMSSLLGGYGYFDMGDADLKSRGPSPEPPFLNRLNSGFSVREIGKKLRLAEY